MDILETIKSVANLAKQGMTIELEEVIVDLRQQVVSMKEENILLREENIQLKEQISNFAKGDPCPKCKQPSWEIESSKPDPTFGDLGGQRRTYKCSECGFTEDKVITE